jgi:hypothetical protein
MDPHDRCGQIIASSGGLLGDLTDRVGNKPSFGEARFMMIRSSATFKSDIIFSLSMLFELRYHIKDKSRCPNHG